MNIFNKNIKRTDDYSEIIDSLNRNYQTENRHYQTENRHYQTENKTTVQYEETPESAHYEINNKKVRNVAKIKISTEDDEPTQTSSPLYCYIDTEIEPDHDEGCCVESADTNADDTNADDAIDCSILAALRKYNQEDTAAFELYKRQIELEREKKREEYYHQERERIRMDYYNNLRKRELEKIATEQREAANNESAAQTDETEEQKKQFIKVILSKTEFGLAFINALHLESKKNNYDNVRFAYKYNVYDTDEKYNPLNRDLTNPIHIILGNPVYYIKFPKAVRILQRLNKDYADDVSMINRFPANLRKHIEVCVIHISQIKRYSIVYNGANVESVKIMRGPNEEEIEKYNIKVDHVPYCINYV